MNLIKTLSRNIRALPMVQRIASRYGRSYWRLPAALRRHVCWEAKIPRLPGAQTYGFGRSAWVPKFDSPLLENPPTDGHRLVAQACRERAPWVTVLKKAWLVGKYATPTTCTGDMLLTGFRDEPRILGLEAHPELETWMANRGWRETSPLPGLEHVWPMVNRLQGNYYHWLVEWCGRLEWIEKYAERTGRRPRLLVPESGSRYLHESLLLLGFAPEECIPWPQDSAPRQVQDLVLPSFRGTDVAPSPMALRWLRERLLRAAKAGDAAPCRKIYISRAKGGWRSVLNDGEVAEWCRSEGFEVVEPHHMPLMEQIRLFAGASLIVGLHGAGMTNLLFAPRAAVIELFGAYGDGVYFAMAQRLGHSYEALVCSSERDDVVVNLGALKERVHALTRSDAKESAVRDGYVESRKVSYVA